MVNDVSEWEILKYMKKRVRWYTTKELILCFNNKITGTEMVKFNRKLNHLLKFKKIEYRKCTRNVAWYHEREYKII